MYLVAPLVHVFDDEVEIFFGWLHLVELFLPAIIDSEQYIQRCTSIFEEIFEFYDPELFHNLKITQKYKVGEFAQTKCLGQFNATSFAVDEHEDLLRLWDVSLLCGFHMHILFAIARHVVFREQLLKENFLKGKNQISFDTMEIDADAVIKLALLIASSLPPNLYRKLVESQFN